MEKYDLKLLPILQVGKTRQQVNYNRQTRPDGVRVILDGGPDSPCKRRCLRWVLKEELRNVVCKEKGMGTKQNEHSTEKQKQDELLQCGSGLQGE